MAWAGSASPRQRDQELLGGAVAVVELRLGHRGPIAAARRLGDERERRRRGPREVPAGLLVVDVDQLAAASTGLVASVASAACRSTRTFPVRSGSSIRGAGARPGSKRAVHEQPPYLLVVDRADELLDVHAAVAERPVVAVGLGNPRVEGDHALESGPHLVLRVALLALYVLTLATPVACEPSERRADVPQPVDELAALVRDGSTRRA